LVSFNKTFPESGNFYLKERKNCLFVAMAGLVLARVVDPATAQRVVGKITGMGV
jgi:hypothetical protein